MSAEAGNSHQKSLTPVFSQEGAALTPEEPSPASPRDTTPGNRLCAVHGSAALSAEEGDERAAGWTRSKHASVVHVPPFLHWSASPLCVQRGLPSHATCLLRHVAQQPLAPLESCWVQLLQRHRADATDLLARRARTPEL